MTALRWVHRIGWVISIGALVLVLVGLSSSASESELVDGSLYVALALGFGAVVAVRARTLDRGVTSICVVILGIVTAGFVATCVHARYRMHIEPFIFIIAAFGAENILRRLTAMRGTRMRSAV